MARNDRLKEEIGWLKVPFGLLFVIDASLLGWVAQSYATASLSLMFAAGIAIIGVSTGIFLINRRAYRRIDNMEDT